MTPRLSREQASDAVEAIGWRCLLGSLCTTVLVSSLAEATRLAVSISAVCGDDADAHLRLDLRPDRIEVSLQTRVIAALTRRDADLAHAISETVDTRWDGVPARPVQSLELAIDALDIAAVLPFWRAVLDYVKDPSSPDDDSLIDPAGQQPTLWFQQLDAPREQRNRIHFDLTVSHDEAERRIAAAVAAGGQVISDSAARAFWILADVEGNEVCVCTWQDRDAHQPIIG